MGLKIMKMDINQSLIKEQSCHLHVIHLDRVLGSEQDEADLWQQTTNGSKNKKERKPQLRGHW